MSGWYQSSHAYSLSFVLKEFFRSFFKWNNLHILSDTLRSFINRINLQGKLSQIGSDSLDKDMLEKNKCYMLDCGAEVFVWMGRNTLITERKTSISAVEVRIFSSASSPTLQFHFFFHTHADWPITGGEINEGICAVRKIKLLLPSSPPNLWPDIIMARCFGFLWKDWCKLYLSRTFSKYNKLLCSCNVPQSSKHYL